MTQSKLRQLLQELDSRLPGEGDHGERVAVYAVATGHRMGLSPEALLELRFSAALHDFGKLELDSELLTGGRILTERERESIQTHPLMASHSLLIRGQAVLESIESHHERWDGEGYPQGLVGKQIPLDARIIGACETFDVMSYGTPWRPRASDAEARQLLAEEAGKAFDPDVVEALLSVQKVIQPLGL